MLVAHVLLFQTVEQLLDPVHLALPSQNLLDGTALGLECAPRPREAAAAPHDGKVLSFFDRRGNEVTVGHRLSGFEERRVDSQLADVALPRLIDEAEISCSHRGRRVFRVLPGE